MQKVFIILVVFAALSAWATGETCTKCGMKSDSGTSQSLVKSSGEISKGICPIDGSIGGNKKPGVVEEIGSVVYGLMSASRKMEELVKQASAKADSFKAEDEGCSDGCSRRNYPDVILSTTPTKLGSDSSCPSSFTPMNMREIEGSIHESGVRVDGMQVAKQISAAGGLEKCQSDASEWAQKILRGKNDVGEAIEDKCPGPCSYSSVIKFVNPVENGSKCSLTVKIQVNCGPPRTDTEWKTKASLVKNWKCEPGGAK